MRHENREEARYLSSSLLGERPYPIYLKHETYLKYLRKTTRPNFKSDLTPQLITKHTDTNYNYHTFAKENISKSFLDQSVERIKEILVNDGKSKLELETDSLNDDLSNTETPEGGLQIGCVELPRSDSMETEAIPATVMYVESDGIDD